MKVLAPVAFLLALQFIPFSSTLSSQPHSAVSHLASTMETNTDKLLNALQNTDGGKSSQASLERF